LAHHGDEMMTEVHQFVHSYVDHDATSAHARNLQRIIQSLGIKSEVYAGEWRGDKSKATFFRDYATNNAPDRTWLLYHLSTASPMAAYLNDRPEHVAMSYHNITPYSYLAPWEPGVAPELEIARQQLKSLSQNTELAVAASHYSEHELREAGFRNTMTAPILFDASHFSRALDQKVYDKLRRAKDSGGADWLFVGRITPHKCQHQIVQAFAVYKRLYDENARLHLVGGLSSHRYWSVLNQYVERLDMQDSVFITKGVSDGALGAYYAAADVFVCLSEHEGFGVPVLEALHNDVPVIAFDAAAVGETLGAGGLVLQDKSPSTVAVAAHRLLADEGLRKAMIAAGHTRLQDFALPVVEKQWTQIIEQMVAE
jgi:glycosyltransferase involved in cell wall biosynthesis